MSGEDVSMLVTYPETNKMFNGMEYAKQVSKKKGEFFHSVVEKLLFNMKMSRPYLDMAASFLTTRVLNSDVENWVN